MKEMKNMKPKNTNNWNYSEKRMCERCGKYFDEADLDPIDGRFLCRDCEGEIQYC